MATKGNDKASPQPVGEVKEVDINGKVFKLGVALHEELENKLKEVLQKIMHAFA